MRAETYQLLKKLISFNTVSKHSNLPLIEFIQNYLHQHNVESHLLFNHTQDKANIVARIGPETPGGVVISGHTDVVPAQPNHWQSPPFELTPKQNLLYGRGTADMKSFLALALAAVPALKQAPLRQPLYLAFSYDEEIGCLGAPQLIDYLKNNFPKPMAVIVGEPTLMQPVVAHKSIVTLKTEVTGLEAHSSQTQNGISAITLAAQLIQFIHHLLQENKNKAQANSLFVPPYDTLQAGTIQGGSAVNIIAKHCAFEWDIRCLPGQNWHHYLEKFNAFAKKQLAPLKQKAGEKAQEIQVNTQVLAEVPAFNNPKGQARVLLSYLNPGFQPQAAPFVSEAGQYQAAGFDVIVCGPGAIDQAHQPNEYITVEQIQAGETFFDRLLQFLCAPSTTRCKKEKA